MAMTAPTNIVKFKTNSVAPKMLGSKVVTIETRIEFQTPIKDLQFHRYSCSCYCYCCCDRNENFKLLI